ncbi:MAG: outer membrane beta-barrel protein [Limisphaerales bacterium]
MKKIITSTTLAALGAASLQAAYAPGLTAVQSSKPWSVSAAVRGFYDDNYDTRPSNPTDGLGAKRGSYGVDINPSFSLNFPLEQTYIGLSYSYDLLYYADRVNNDADHQHQAQFKLSHQFSPHYKLDVNDSFVDSQQPELLVPSSGLIANPLVVGRGNMNNIMNAGSIKFSADLTETLASEVSYANTLYVYDNHGPGSFSALLDRMEHLGMVDLRWSVLPTTVALLGYQYGFIDQTSNDLLTPAGPAANVRNSESHYVFVGVDQNFTTQLNGSVRVGGEYTQYPNAPAGAQQSAITPYADANLTYTYNPGSYVQVGARHQRNPTYLGFLPGSAVPLMDSEATAAYVALNHRITGKLTGNVMANYQNSVYHVPGVSDKADNYFSVTLDLAYQINQFLAADVNYTFYRLDSDLPNTSFTRNLIFLGVRASY